MEVLLHFHMTICEENEVIYKHNIKLPYLMPYWRNIDSLTHFTLNNWLRYEHSERQDIFSPHPVFCCSLSLFGSIYKQLFFPTVTSKKSWFILLPSKKQIKEIKCHLSWTLFALAHIALLPSPRSKSEFIIPVLAISVGSAWLDLLIQLAFSTTVLK